MTLVKMQGATDHGMSNPNEYIYNATPTQKAQEESLERGQKKMQEPEDQDDCYGIVSSR